MSNLVSLVDTKKWGSLEETLKDALILINYSIPKNIDKVVIKPNLCYYWKSSTGYTTDPEMVRSLINVLQEEIGPVEIIIAEADASAMRTNIAFKLLGYEKVASETGAMLYNLSEGPVTEIKQEINSQIITFHVPQILKEADLLINVPKLKLMKETKITCAMKNLFGAIADRRKLVYHKHLSETIVAANKVIKPHLNIVDGIHVLGSYPKKFNLILAGTDTFSVDWVVAQIAGYNPNNINFLKLGLKEKLATNTDIRSVGEDIEKYKDLFPRDTGIPTGLLWKAQFQLLNLYTKIVGDIVPPFLEE